MSPGLTATNSLNRVSQGSDSQRSVSNCSVPSIKGPLEYISDLELPEEQLVDMTTEGDLLQNDDNDTSLCSTVIAQKVSANKKLFVIFRNRLSMFFLFFGNYSAVI